MKEHFTFAIKVLFALGIFVLFGWVSQSFGVNWGKLELAPTATVSVTGQADGQQLNQIARFYAEVSANNENKEIATEEVNEAMSELLAQLEAFGIPEEDITTEFVGVYENQGAELAIYPPRAVEEGWRATNSISVVLRDIDRASELATLLTESGATNVSGPNFSVDDTTDLDQQLLGQAMADAREKAELLLSGTNQKIIRVISVSEGGSYNPMPYYRETMAMGGDQAVNVPVEPGSQTIYKSLNVVFEIGR